MPDISRLVIEIDSKGVLKATGDLEAFSRMSQKAGKGTDDLTKKMGALQLVVNRLPGPLKSVAAGLIGLASPAQAAVSAFFEIGDAAAKFVKESISAFADFEVIKTNLEVVMGSAEQANKTFDELRQMAGRTPFNTEQLAEAAIMLRQVGTSTKDLISTLTMLGDVSGGSSEKFNRIVQNYAQIQSKMSALSIDIDQFAMAGIPIYKTLEEIGVRGTATADDIQEAFRRMTGEGGQFFGAMEKGPKTIDGLKESLKGLKEQNKALWAEYNGLPDFVKNFYETQAAAISKHNEMLADQIELKKIAERKESGTATFIDYYREAELQIKHITDTMEGIQKNMASGLTHAYSGQSGSALVEWQRRLEIQNAIIERYQPMIDAHNQMVQAQAEYNAMLEKSDKEYRALQAKIDECYAKTHQGQEEAIENEIEWWRTEQQRMRYIKEYKYDGSELRVGQKQVGIEQEEYDKIEAIIQMLTDSRSKVNDELSEWQKIFKKTMNLSDTDAKQDWFKKQSTAISEFTKILATANDRMKILSATFGTDLTNSLEQTAAVWEQLASDMIMSGEWQADTEVFLQVAENAREARDALNEANFDAYISGLDRELDLLRMTTQEMEKQKLITECKITDEGKINQALTTQNLLRAEQDRINFLSSATGFSVEEVKGLNSEQLFEKKVHELEKRLKDALELSELKEVGLNDFSHAYIDELDRVEKAYEDLYKAVSSSNFIEIIGNLASQAASAGEWENLSDIYDQYGTLVTNFSSAMLAHKDKAKQERGKNYEEDIKECEKLIWLSKEELKIREFMERFGMDEKAAKDLFRFEKQIEQTEALRDALIQLKDAGLQLAASGLVTFAHDLGKAFQDGSNASSAFDSAIKNMLKSLIDAMPQLLLNVGLQLVSAGNWQMGLAFIGASGLMSFVSGLISDAQNNNNNDQLSQLNQIQQQISDLIKSQKEQEEYYLTKKRNIDSRALMNVNDAIITPQGVVHTHPEDFIIATKTPGALMNSAAAPVVYVNVINNTPDTVTTNESVDENGFRKIELIIEQTVRRGMASGAYDSSMDIMRQRRTGRKVNA
jgi:archaellum component FlaC